MPPDTPDYSAIHNLYLSEDMFYSRTDFGFLSALFPISLMDYPVYLSGISGSCTTIDWPGFSEFAIILI